jgi:hypothetical protein
MTTIQFFCDGAPISEPQDVEYIPVEDYIYIGTGTKREFRQIRKIVYGTGKATEIHLSAPSRQSPTRVSGSHAVHLPFALPCMYQHRLKRRPLLAMLLRLRLGGDSSPT